MKVYGQSSALPGKAQDLSPVVGSLRVGAAADHLFLDADGRVASPPAGEPDAGDSPDSSPPRRDARSGTEKGRAPMFDIEARPAAAWPRVRG
jgi:hypothetical protein